MKNSKILVVGATGGTGRATVERLISEGYGVTAFSRRPDRLGIHSDRLRFAYGDALDLPSLEKAVAGHDAVIVTLGISENPLRVRLIGPAHTPMNVRSAGTANVISAMRKHGVRRLIVLTSYGVGETRERLGLIDGLFFELILKPQIEDTEMQNDSVSRSDLDWVLVQPVHLTDDEQGEMPFVSTEGDVGKPKVSRASVARFMTAAVASPDYVHKTVALSGAV